MSAAIVIPARYGSTRLPAKPLLAETGKPLIQHVYERACQATRAQQVLVATDDVRILEAVEAFGGRGVLTRADHVSGTDRIAEAARHLDAELIVNLQGDEPLIDPASLDHVIGLLQDDPQAVMATLATPLREAEAYRSPNVVKVVCDQNGHALYFSRAPIPFGRDAEPELRSCPPVVLQHVGLYAYRRAFLFRFAALPPSRLEQIEKLEQLRALEAGVRIRVGLTAQATLGVDTLEDYHRFVALVRCQAGSCAA
ncbi:MAG: 3-deoxy-manno-octulosonate cytidylyltransferase [Gemmataceae bacterium]